MDITYLGDASFLLKGERLVAINPAPGGHAADIVLHSRRQNRGKLIVDGPGEYEIGGILIITQERGAGPSAALYHAVEIGGLNVVHLGSTAPEMTERQIAALGPVDVLLLPADDVRAAHAAVRALEPRVVLPFGARAAELAGQLGLRDARQEPRFSWNGAGTPPKVVLLKAASSKRRAA